MWWVAHEILETAQSPHSNFPFLFDFGLGLGTWTRAFQLVWDWSRIGFLLLHTTQSPRNTKPANSTSVKSLTLKWIQAKLFFYVDSRVWCISLNSFIWKLNPEKLILLITSLFPDTSRCHVLLNWEHFSPRPGPESETKSIWGYEYSDKARQVLSCLKLWPIIRAWAWSKDRILRYTLNLRLRPLSNITMRWYWKTPSLVFIVIPVMASFMEKKKVCGFHKAPRKMFVLLPF